MRQQEAIRYKEKKEFDERGLESLHAICVCVRETDRQRKRGVGDQFLPSCHPNPLTPHSRPLELYLENASKLDDTSPFLTLCSSGPCLPGNQEHQGEEPTLGLGCLPPLPSSTLTSTSQKSNKTHSTTLLLSPDDQVLSFSSSPQTSPAG